MIPLAGTAEAASPNQRRHAASAASTASAAVSVPAMLLIGLLIALLINMQTLVAVWQTNAFFDSDDAMQIAQLRDWLGGQGWFDNLQRRMDPPWGVAMHWTHVVEVPMALLLRAFELFVAPAAAERMMRIAYPLLCQLGFAACAMLIARRLLAPDGRGAALLLALVSITCLSQFPPGRITHNAAQIVLLMLMVYATLGSVAARPGRRSAALAGACAAFSLAISLEDLPFIIGMAAVFGTVWIVRGSVCATALAWFGGSFAAGALAAFLAVVPPWRFAQAACDAFSVAHLLAATVGGGGFLILGLFPRRFGSALGRAAGVGAAGALALLVVGLTHPECLGDPFTAVDKVVRTMWMGGVTEAQPMVTSILKDPLGSLAVVMPILLGLIATAAAAAASEGLERGCWLVIAAFGAVGVATAFWQVRALTYTAALTVFGAAWLFARLRAAVVGRRKAWGALAAVALFPFAPPIWAAVGSSRPDPAAPYGAPSACYSTPAFKALDALPAGLIMGPIDPGSYILALTHHAALTGPYHRDNRGLRLTVDAMLSDTATAESRIRSSKADYFALCPAARELDWYEEHAPQGFVSRLRRGEVPAWLRRIDVAGTPYRVYRVLR